GDSAGANNTMGQDNSFFGGGAGTLNQTGGSNTFLGQFAGHFTNGGSENTFVGQGNGTENTTGSQNTFVGAGSGGGANSTGNDNTSLGYGAGPIAANLFQSTAIGANAQVSTSHTIVLGTNAETTLIPGKLSIGLGTAGGNALCVNGSN